jgi:hypothetical protein
VVAKAPHQAAAAKPEPKPEPPAPPPHAPPLPPPPAHTPPAPTVDVLACFAHLMTAVEHLARAQGAPLDVMQELAALGTLLGKES